MSARPLPFRHVLLALLTVTIWGFNFAVSKLALAEIPPLLLCALRFLLVVFPAIFFVPKPAVSWRVLIRYGTGLFSVQFGLLFLGMHLGVSAGLAALVLQAQVFITIAFAVLALKERPSSMQLLGAGVAGIGLAIVAARAGADASVAGLVCVLFAALGWGYANFTARQIGKVNALALVVWSSAVVPLPMLLASLAFEGPAAAVHSLTHVSSSVLLCLVFIVYVSTLIGFSIWSWLLARHAAAAVSPFALGVPVAGMLSSALLLGESLPPWKMLAAALVVAGLAINVFGGRLLPLLRPAQAEPPS